MLLVVIGYPLVIIQAAEHTVIAHIVTVNHEVSGVLHIEVMIGNIVIVVAVVEEQCTRA